MEKCRDSSIHGFVLTLPQLFYVSYRCRSGSVFTTGPHCHPFRFFFFLFFFSELGTELRALRFLGKHSTTELNPQPQTKVITFFFFFGSFFQSWGPNPGPCAS
ncbi:rCG63015 [Rattus norvegicus]|uniref:RCG63015 n=1 Tax=Rattus norvegicus TaxID=10116 RepID=A6IUC7_RAT|nr:rCG63015 [Rattus norvegicus]